MTKTVTIFGSSVPRPGEKEYEDAYKLGKRLGRQGFSVCSGGYQGIMDAVSKGAFESGAEAIGVTVSVFRSAPSAFLTKRIECTSLYERIKNMISFGHGFIILPGGTGTLLELAVIWEFMNKGLIKEKPAACFGQIWDQIVPPMDERTVSEKRKGGLIKIFSSIDDCAEYLIAELSR